MNELQYTMEYASPFGRLTISSDGEAVTGLWFERAKYYLETVGEHIAGRPLPVFDRATAWLDAYFGGENPDVSLPLNPRGSAFRQSVWRILQNIPYGQVRTYGSIAQELAKAAGKDAMSAQAVGGAVGHNPISIIIPCHRVVGANGSLTGFGGGIQNKVKLLQLEKADMSALFVPTKGTAL